MKNLVSAELKMRNLCAKALEWYNGTDERVYEDPSVGLFYIGYDKANASGPYTFDELEEGFCELAEAPWWDREDFDFEEE